jgi:hypothetical protein
MVVHVAAAASIVWAVRRSEKRQQPLIHH